MNERQKLRYPLYPHIMVESKVIQTQDERLTEVVTNGATYLRRKHTDGKYYLQLFRQSKMSSNATQNLTKEESIVKDWINFEVYMAMCFGEIDPHVKVAQPNGHEDLLFLLDLCQESEEERLGLYE